MRLRHARLDGDDARFGVEVANSREPRQVEDHAVVAHRKRAFRSPSCAGADRIERNAMLRARCARCPGSNRCVRGTQRPGESRARARGAGFPISPAPARRRRRRRGPAGFAKPPALRQTPSVTLPRSGAVVRSSGSLAPTPDCRRSGARDQSSGTRRRAFRPGERTGAARRDRSDSGAASRLRIVAKRDFERGRKRSRRCLDDDEERREERAVDANAFRQQPRRRARSSSARKAARSDRS